MRPDHEELLSDLFAPSPDGTLAEGKRILRRRRILRRLRAGGLGVAAAAALTWMLLPARPAPTPGPVAAAPHPAPAAQGLLRLTDEQLLSLFPGKPVALATVHGRKQLLFARPEDRRQHVGIGYE